MAKVLVSIIVNHSHRGTMSLGFNRIKTGGIVENSQLIAQRFRWCHGGGFLVQTSNKMVKINII